MTRDEYRQFIKSSPWFEGAPDHALDALAAAAIYKEYPANKCLWSLGEASTEIFGMVAGRVRISVASEMGHQFAIVDQDQGSWLNNPSLDNDLGRAVEARTLTPSRVLVIPRQAVLDIADDWPLLYRNLFHDKVVESRGLYEILSGVLFYPLRARVAGRLLTLLEEHGDPVEDGVLLDIKLSQNDFARLAMGSRQRVNRIFREWDRLGLVVMRDDHLLIKDLEGLKKEVVPFE
jgi:CRP/FNR family cyclic AMP-dependent transcriptional regulator